MQAGAQEYAAQQPRFAKLMDVAIAGGKIAQVGKDILPSTARQVTEAERGSLIALADPCHPDGV